MIRTVALLGALTVFGAVEQHDEAGEQRGEEASDPRTDTTQQQEPRDADAADTEAASDEGDESSPETFVPSENISEDFDVPFPVDI